MEGARALSWAGRDLWPSPCFGVSSCPLEASGRSKGAPTKLPTAGGFGREERDAFSSRLGAGKETQTIFSKFVELSSASCCGALSTHLCGLGDSLTPNLPPPGNFMDRANSRATVNFISSGKTFGVCLNASF